MTLSTDNICIISCKLTRRVKPRTSSKLTGMLAVRNLVCGESHDLWQVNAEDGYHEEIRGAQTQEVVGGALAHAFPKLDPLALGTAIGLAGALVLFLATLVWSLVGISTGGPGLGLLSQFFPLYDVTPIGSLLGLVYGFTLGFLAGWGFAFIRNLSVLLSMVVIERGAVLPAIWKAFY